MFEPPLPSEIPECVTPHALEFHNRETPLTFGISVFFRRYIFNLATFI